MALILIVLNIVAQVATLGLVGFLWVKLGHDYQLKAVTRLKMTLSVPPLIFTVLMKTEMAPTALRDLTLAARNGAEADVVAGMVIVPTLIGGLKLPVTLGFLI